jgi:hypothetical protein
MDKAHDLMAELDETADEIRKLSSEQDVNACNENKAPPVQEIVWIIMNTMWNLRLHTRVDNIVNHVILCHVLISC